MARKKERQLRLFPMGQLVGSEGQPGSSSEDNGEPDLEEWVSIMEDLGEILARGPFQVSRCGPGRCDQERFRGA